MEFLKGTKMLNNDRLITAFDLAMKRMKERYPNWHFIKSNENLCNRFQLSLPFGLTYEEIGMLIHEFNERMVRNELR